MISMYHWQQIKEKQLQGMSIKKLARIFKMSKNTIRKYLRTATVPTIKKRFFGSLIDPFKNDVETMVKKGMIGTRIFEELRQKGFKGSQSGVHRYLQKNREEINRISQMTTRFETKAGEQMQYDWKEWQLMIGTTVRKIYIHSLILSFSRKKFYVASFGITTSDILLAIYEGMMSFGGFARELVIDNPKQMVLTHRKDGMIRYNDTFLRFCGLFGLIPNACENYRAQTKGKVERPFLYLQEHFLRGLEVKDLSELESRLADFTDAVNAKYHGGIEATPNDRFEVEKSALQALPLIEPSAWMVTEVRKVSRDGYISLGAHFYPVPMRLCGKQVLVESRFGKAFKVLESGTVVCEFPKRFEGPSQIPHPEHVTINAAFGESKRRKRSAPLIHFLTLFGERGALFFEGLKAEQRENVYSHLNDILLFTQFYQLPDMISVLDECIVMGAFHKNTVKRLLASKILKIPSSAVGISIVVPSAPISRPLSVYKELMYV